MKEQLRRFQRDFIKAVENPAYDTVALSGPRGLGKTFIAAHVLARCLTPGDVLHQPGKEYILGAASIEQARLTYAFIRSELEPTGEYRWIDSATRLGATHVSSNTKLRAISSMPRLLSAWSTSLLSAWTNRALLRMSAVPCSPIVFLRPRVKLAQS